MTPEEEKRERRWRAKLRARQKAIRRKRRLGRDYIRPMRPQPQRFEFHGEETTLGPDEPPVEVGAENFDPGGFRDEGFEPHEGNVALADWMAGANRGAEPGGGGEGGEQMELLREILEKLAELERKLDELTPKAV